jgi:hypothetical protein
MSRHYGCALLAALLLAGCSAPASVVETAVSRTQAIWTAVPSQTAYTTYTPAPTYTPLPTLTAEPTTVVTVEVTRLVSVLVTPTLAPYFVEVYRFTGAGRETTDVFSMQAGSAQVSWKSAGANSFTLYLKEVGRKGATLLESTMGPTEGQQILNLTASDAYFFDVRTNAGDWEIVVEFRP